MCHRAKSKNFYSLRLHERLLFGASIDLNLDSTLLLLVMLRFLVFGTQKSSRQCHSLPPIRTTMELTLSKTVKLTPQPNGHVCRSLQLARRHSALQMIKSENLTLISEGKKGIFKKLSWICIWINISRN